MSEEVKYEICRSNGLPQTIWDKITEKVRSESLDIEYADSDYILFNSTKDSEMICEDIIKDSFKEFQGKGILVRLWYMEREPDEIFEL